ncbi:MAG: hypothetical protein KKH98_00700, partial [Spirochaetes bacterium]|nr:hypothetical protein [Spirochaetota bacterium]
NIIISCVNFNSNIFLFLVIMLIQDKMSDFTKPPIKTGGRTDKSCLLLKSKEKNITYSSFVFYAKGPLQKRR